MPGTPHEILIMALRDRPALLSELMSRATGAPPCGPLVVADSTLRFARSIELRPDLVFRGRHPRWILFELQNRIDERKRRSWLLAAGLLCFQENAMGEVVVLTSSRRVAAWARRIGRQRGDFGTRFELRPIVVLLAGAQIEALLDPEHPELALFAAWAMRDRRGPEARRVIKRAVDLTERLPRRLRGAQERAILAVLSEPMLAFLKEMAMDVDKIPQSPALKRFLRQMEAIGKAKGKAEGKAEGLQQGLLAIFSARELSLSARDRARINACADVVELERWLARAVTAASVREAIGEASAKKARAPRRAAPKRATRRKGVEA